MKEILQAKNWIWEMNLAQNFLHCFIFHEQIGNKIGSPRGKETDRKHRPEVAYQWNLTSQHELSAKFR